MFRRSRFSVRPNVGTTGRTAAAAPQEAGEPAKDVSESNAPAAPTDAKSVVTPAENPPAPGDGNDQNGEGTSSSAAVQRRKRFSVKPKVAPGRPSTLPRTPKPSAKAASETPAEVHGSDLDKPTTSSRAGSTAGPAGLQSPKRRRPSEESKQPRTQPKPTPVSSDSSGPSADPQAEKSPEQTDLPADGGKQSERGAGGQVKEVSPRPPDKVPPSLPDKEAVEISEKAKTLVSSKSGLSLSPAAFSLSRLLNDPSDLQRLAKAQKLRELLRQEKHKEKKLKKAKARAKEYTLDPAKMTMRDLIRYLPLSNPMTSSLEESAQENETVVPPSPGREESPERAQEPEPPPETASSREEEEEVGEEEDEESLMVPQVKVAEDGSLIIDEESLTVEVQRAKGPNPAQDRDPIFERGSTTTYSSFRKGTYSKPWTAEETDMFFLAISMVGTDFSMICQLFPHRARSEIKNKFKKEERENAWRIDKAFRERRKLDIEYFSKLLEKVLEVQKNRKKLKSLAQKNSSKKSKRKGKGKKTARRLSDLEEEDEDDESQLPELEDEEGGEKENEDLCNEGETPVSKPKRQRKRKTRPDASNEEPSDKKGKTGESSNEQGEARTPEDTEAALPEDHTSSDTCEKTDSVNESKVAAVKPAKLSRGKAPKPIVPLGRKWGKKPPPPSAKAKDAAADEGEESVADGASAEQVNEESTETSERKSADISSEEEEEEEEEDATVQPPKPTRYGRVPKPTKPLAYSDKKDASDAAPSSPAAASAAKHKPKCSAKRGRSSKQPPAQEPKKPKLVTLRASQSEYSDEDDEKQRGEEELEEEEHLAWSPSKDSVAPVFVPASLRSPPPVVSEVEETMEELDILANMPDVLGISQDALCSAVSPERAHNETVEPCEHQLDLLVDVIDFLSSEHTEVSADESYNEAAQTLLTIGNPTHLPQSAQNVMAAQDHTAETTSVCVRESAQNLKEESTPVAQEERASTPLASCRGVTDTSEADPGPQLQSGPQSSKNGSPQTRKARSSKVKPKPNLGPGSRPAQPESQPSTKQKAEEGVAESAPETTAQKLQECSPASLTDSISCSEVKLPESTGQVGSDAATSNLSLCFSEAQLEPSTDTKSRPESSDEKPMCHAEISGSDNSHTPEASVTEPQVEQESNADSVPVQDGGQPPAAFVTPVGNLPVGPKAQSEVASVCQTTRSRLQKVKPKPNLARTSRTARSTPHAEKDSGPTQISETRENTRVKVEPEACGIAPDKPSQTAGSDSVLMPSLDSGPAASSTKSEILSESPSDSADTEPQPGRDSAPAQQSSGGPDLPVSQNEQSEVQSTCPARRGRLQKVKPKPNLAQTSRTARSRPDATKDPVMPAQPVDRPASPAAEPGSADGVIVEAEAQPAHSTTLPVEPGQSTGAASISGLVSCTADKPTEESSSTSDQKTNVGLSSTESSEPSVPQRRRHFPNVRPNLGSSSRTAQTNAKDVEKPSEPDTSSDVTPEQQPVDGTKPNTELNCELDATARAPESNTRPPAEDGESRMSSAPDPKDSSLQPCSQSDSAVESQDGARRCSDPDQQSQPAQSTDDVQSELSDSPKSLKKAPQPRRGRLIKPKPNLGRSARPAQPQQNTTRAEPDSGTRSETADGSEPAAPDDALQNTSTFTEGTQSLTIFPDMLSQQVPSDPDEPFFILSLTEIPVCSSGEAADGTAEPPPYLPAADVSAQQQSGVPAERLAAAGDESLSHGTASTEESAEPGPVGVKDTGPDPTAYADSMTENPVDPHASSTDPPDNAETENPPTKQRPTGRRANLQVKPNTARKKPASKTLAADAQLRPEATHVDEAAERDRPRSDPTPGAAQFAAEVSVSQRVGRLESSSAQEEPTGVSQYFLTDIFTEVEEG